MYGKTSLESQNEISNKAKIRTTRYRCERDIETAACWELTADAWELTCWSDGATSAVGQLAPSYRRPEPIRQANRLAKHARHSRMICCGEKRNRSIIPVRRRERSESRCLLARELLVTVTPQNDKCVVVTVHGPRTGRYFAKFDELPVTRIFDAKTQIIAHCRRHI